MAAILFRQASHSETFNEVLKNACITHGLRGDPMTNREMRVTEQKQLRLLARLLQSTQLREARRKKTPRSGPIGLLPPQSCNGHFVVARCVLGLPERPVVAARRMGLSRQAFSIC
jgi:hypothetical protein